MPTSTPYGRKSDGMGMRRGVDATIGPRVPVWIGRGSTDTGQMGLECFSLQAPLADENSTATTGRGLLSGRGRGGGLDGP